MKKILYVVPAALLFLASCASSRSVYNLAGEWNVVGLNGQTITPVENVTPVMGFNLNDSSVYGFTGCNRMMGQIDAKAFMKGKADFGRLATTRMLCQDDKYERALLDALSKATESEVKGNVILLKDKDGNVLVTLQKK